MKIKTVLVALVLAFSSVGFAQPKMTSGYTNTASGIRSVDFLNYSYRNAVCPGIPKTVRVRNGKFNVGDNVVNIAEGDVVYGDVTGDRNEDAVVQLRCSTGTSFRAFEIHVYTFQNGQARLLARLNSDEVGSDYQKAYPDSIMCCAGDPPKIQVGHLIVEALTDGLLLSPENTTTFDYKLSGNKFVLSGKPAKTKTAEAGDQATAQEKNDLSQLILRDKEVQENIKDGLSPDAVAQTMTVKKVDINRDGQPEYIVGLEETVPLGSLCGALANCPNWVYRKSGSEYQLLLRTRGRELIIEKTLTNKFSDVRSEGGDTALQGSFVNYKFDGNKYQAKGCFTRTYATKRQKEKIAPYKCDENNP